MNWKIKIKIKMSNCKRNFHKKREFMNQNMKN